MTIWVELTPVAAKHMIVEYGSGWSAVAPTPGNKRLVPLSKIMSMDTHPIVDESSLQQPTVIGTSLRVHGYGEPMEVYEPKEEIARVTKIVDAGLGFRPPTDVILKPDFSRIKRCVAMCAKFNIDYGHAEAALTMFLKDRNGRAIGDLASGMAPGKAKSVPRTLAECVDNTRVRFGVDTELHMKYFADIDAELEGEAE